jgi:hypothetical protein
MTISTSIPAARLAVVRALLLSAVLAPAPANALCGAFVAPTGYAAYGACGPDATAGTICDVGCNSAVGYIGAATDAVCMADDQWTSPSGCVLASCSVPAPPTGYAVSCPGRTYGSSCAIACDDAAGYVGSPTSPSSTCLLGGWSTPFSSLGGCALATCGDLQPPPGYAASCTGASFGSTCSLSCAAADGYEGVPSHTSAVCQLNGQWSLSGTVLSGCSVHDCGVAVGPPGYALTCDGGTTYGSTCSVACDAAAGFLGTPSQASTACTFSGWSPDPGAATGCALADCGPLTFANADVSDCDAHSRHGETCAVACNAGFAGSPSASCSASGTWTTGGSCDAIACWPSPSTNGDACGGSGQTCLSGACVTPAAGQLCALPADLALGVASTFPLDGQHDLLSTGGCTGGVLAGRDVFVRAAVTAGDYRLSVNSTAGSAVQAVVLGGCSAAACAPLALAPDAAFLSTTVHFDAAGDVVLALHVLDPVPAGTLVVTLAREAPPEEPGSGCASGGAGLGVLGLFAALRLLSTGRDRRRARTDVLWRV